MRSATDDALNVEAHLGVLRRYAFVLTRKPDEAEDLVQEALLRAIASAHTWRPGRPVRAWLLAIVHNVHVSRCRRQRVETVASGELADLAPRATPPAQLGHVELGDTLKALFTLPEEQREVLVLVALEGLAYREAAELLDIPVGTLMSRLGRARAALRAGTGAGEAPGGTALAPSLRVVR